MTKPIATCNMPSWTIFTGFYLGGPYLSQDEYAQKDIVDLPTIVEKSQLHEIIRLDQHIRLLAQREESLNHKARAWKKTIEIENDMKQLPEEDFDLKIKSTEVQRIKSEYTMFRLVSGLPSEFEKQLRNLRRDPLWYMRKEMVHDCAGRGGCCSRGCDCCARRSLSENTKTRGHCTAECWCCTSFRNSSLCLTEEDQMDIALDLDQLMESSEYALRMVNCYFRPLRLRYRFGRRAGNVMSGLKRTIKQYLHSK